MNIISVINIVVITDNLAKHFCINRSKNDGRFLCRQYGNRSSSKCEKSKYILKFR